MNEQKLDIPRLDGGPIGHADHLRQALEDATAEVNAAEATAADDDLETGRWSQQAWLSVLDSAVPEELDGTGYLTVKTCETARCLAGFGASRAGLRPILDEGEVIGVTNEAGIAVLRAGGDLIRRWSSGLNYEGIIAGATPAGSAVVCDVDGAASAWFGLGPDVNVNGLYRAQNSLHTLWAYAYALTDGAVTMPEGQKNAPSDDYDADDAYPGEYEDIVKVYEALKDSFGRVSALYHFGLLSWATMVSAVTDSTAELSTIDRLCEEMEQVATAVVRA